MIYEKLCIFCRHFTMGPQENDWSEDTAGSNFSMSCTKGYWEFNTYKASEDDYRKTLLTAESCKEYEEIKGE